MEELLQSILNIVLYVVGGTAALIVVYVAIAERERRITGAKRIVPVDLFWGRAASLWTIPNTIFTCSAKYRITARPPLDEVFTAGAKVLEEGWEQIRDEAQAIVREQAEGKNRECTGIKGDNYFKLIADPNWKKFYMRWYYSPWTQAAQSFAPKTIKLLEEAEKASGLRIPTAMFSIMEPGAVVKPHRGGWRGVLRYHLGLQCPGKGCAITVDGTPYAWKDGESFIFDDGYLHEVQNTTNKARIILFLDIEMPMYNFCGARSFNRWFQHTLGPKSQPESLKDQIAREAKANGPCPVGPAVGEPKAPVRAAEEEKEEKEEEEEEEVEEPRSKGARRRHA